MLGIRAIQGSAAIETSIIIIHINQISLSIIDTAYLPSVGVIVVVQSYFFFRLVNQEL
jgi:hypothetical protein